MQWRPREDTEVLKKSVTRPWSVWRGGLGWSCLWRRQQLTRFLATGWSSIQVCRFWSARATSFWHNMSSDRSEEKADWMG